jgi:pilus assembly protein CpaE
VSEDIRKAIRGKIIVFASAKGGVGKTCLSVNAAVGLAVKGFSTCIVDGNFQFGDVGFALDILPKLTISDLVNEIESLTSTRLNGYFQEHETGLKLLAAPVRPELADLISTSSINIICSKIIELFEYVIVDLAAGLSENNMSFLEAAHRIYLVTDPDMVSLKNTKSMLGTLKVLGLDEKVSIVVNRADMDTIVKLKDVASILEVESMVVICNDFEIVSRAYNIGIPFIVSKSKSKISQEIIKLVEEISSDKVLAKAKKRKRNSLLKFL